MMILLYLLSVIGLVGIITSSKLFRPVREWSSKKRRDSSSQGLKIVFWWIENWLNCELCSSVWIGLVLYPAYEVELCVILLPLAGSGVVWILTDLIQKD